jgi:hypothetical protein
MTGLFSGAGDIGRNRFVNKAWPQGDPEMLHAQLKTIGQVFVLLILTVLISHFAK